MKRRERRAIAFVRAHPVAWLLRRAAIEARSVQAPATLWLLCLNEEADERARSSRQWPKSPEQLARTFGELREGLALLGIVLTPYRGRFQGRVSRVWRLETQAAHRQQGRFWRGSLLLWIPGKAPKNGANTSNSPRLTPAKAENGPNVSANNGRPKMGRRRQLLPVEDCARITPGEAAHVEAKTEETPVAGSHARRLWLLCPQCQKRKRFLYQRPGAQAWACFECNRLTTRKRQMKGTNTAFAQWLTPSRYERMSRKHPAVKRFWEAMKADWENTVAPFDLSRVEVARQLELRLQYGEKEVRRMFEERRLAHANRWMNEEGVEVGREVLADIEAWWKWRNRSKPKAD